MSKLAWYWHRLRAMSPVETALHARKKLRQFADARRQPDWPTGEMKASGAFPALPDPEKAPEGLREVLKRDAEMILAGHWKAFGHLDLQVDDPPKWHKDYLVGRDLVTSKSAFKLNHRDLPDGADIKLIWELSRWHQLVRLAMAAYVLADDRAGRKCIEWLEDWMKHNPPYRGWNWTSALEVGMRLIQFTWIDALLSEAGARTALSEMNRADDETRTRLFALRKKILAPHARFAWRQKSFGSSANNHLLGELVGVIVATVRWPELRRWATTLEDLQRRWEQEVLAQFADDGGNKEQALNYQLFSWEFCWQARVALASADRKISSQVEERMASAARFFWEVQVRREPWDYGDSDNGFVTPLFGRAETALLEWRDWLSQSVTGLGAGPAYWLGEPPNVGPPLLRSDPICASHVNDWWIYHSSGVAVCELGHWWLRWDLSPLGYLPTAAHGHLDALHLSIWFKGVAVVVDPGTGAYYADAPLRSWLASRSAHNAPCPIGLDFPKRTGPFLWSEHHTPPTWEPADCEIQGIGVIGELKLPPGIIRRTVTRCSNGDGWNVVDEFDARKTVSREFTVHWQFAPGAFVKMLGERKFTVRRGNIAVTVEVSGDWEEPVLVEDQNRSGWERKDPGADALAGMVSPAFRRVDWAPFLKLTARPEPGQPCVFRTTFLASQHA